MNTLRKQNYSTLEESLKEFRSISLKEMNKARLMNRLDNKFLLNLSQLEELLPELQKHYDVLEIKGSPMQNYTSYYYDTKDFDMYKDHHNRRANRYKVRQRVYNNSGDSFFEIKCKNNKGFTNKVRIETEKAHSHIPSKYFDFISNNTPYHALQLRRVMENNFDRFTLTNHKRNQRITVDTGITCWYGNKPLELPNLVVAEIKSTRDDIDKTIFNLFQQNGIHAGSMSKYSLGMAMLNPDLKSNLFKQRIHTLNKICNDNEYLDRRVG